MLRKLLLSVALLATSLSAPLAATAQGLVLPMPSPLGTATQQVGLTTISLNYSRPSTRGRAIWGNVVPYGAIWRTGANASTKVTFSTDVKVGGVAVPAGTYALLTIPTQSTWTVILSKNLNVVGAQGYAEADDAVRLTIAPRKGDYTETLTLAVANIKENSCELELRWDELVVAVGIEVEVAERSLANVGTAVSGAGRSLTAAANYLADKSTDLDNARRYAEASLALREDAYTLLVLAKVLAKQGDYTSAVKHAERSNELAKLITDNPGTRDFYLSTNDRNLTEWRPKMAPEKPAKKKK